MTAEDLSQMLDRMIENMETKIVKTQRFSSIDRLTDHLADLRALKAKLEEK